MGNTSSKSSNSAKYELIEKVAIDYATTLNLENIEQKKIYFIQMKKIA